MRVNVKWGKEVFNDVEVDMDQPPLVFKTQLFTLSGVAPERCKVMIKGKMLKDNDWGNVKLKEGQQVMMMGSAESAPVIAPEKAPVFLEDLPEEEQNAAPLRHYGAGLKNLGNTCYMNSTVQCLYAIPELRSSLQNQSEEANSLDSSQQLTSAAGALFREIDRSAGPVMPVRFLLMLRDKFPQFAETGEGGMYKQQDADECWGQIVQSFKENLKGDGGAAALPVVQDLFGVNFLTKLECEESKEEIVTETTETKLKCVIPFGGRPVNHLHEGIEEGLKSDREQRSEKLERNVDFKGTAQVTRLPPYLVVQVVRFFYRRDTQQKAKILKKISFPANLDAYDFCSPDMKAQLDGPRKRAEDIRNEEVEREIAKKELSKKEGEEENGDASKAGGSGSAPEGGAEQDADGDATMDEASAPVEPPNQEMTGAYDLLSVLTHKGRSADSGHYEAWVKKEDGQWVEFDDDNLILRKEEEILNLSGGGDWHMAYLLLYKAKKVPMS